VAVVELLEYIYRVTEVVDRVSSKVPRVSMPIGLGLNSLIYFTYRDNVVNYPFYFVVTLYSSNWW